MQNKVCSDWPTNQHFLGPKVPCQNSVLVFVRETRQKLIQT